MGKVLMSIYIDEKTMLAAKSYCEKCDPKRSLSGLIEELLKTLLADEGRL